MDERSQPKHKAAGARARYDRDLYGWASEQAALLRAGRVDEADAANIAEELEDVGSEQYDKLESALRLILLHLLKWDHQSERRSRSWWAAISVQRNQVRRILRKNPGLKPRVKAATADAYEDARIEAAAQTRLGPRKFPAQCPYSWDDILERPVDWPR
ncbi:MAG TPA: DUF29 domain-containing protein [Xanthobacteraceae bacterium]